MKIHVFYSHYNITGTDNKYRPNWFNYEKCFINLLNTIKDKNVDLHLIMDGKVEDNWIKNYKNHYTSHEITGGSMEAVAPPFFDIVKATPMEENDLVYILENDYLHVSDWVNVILDLYKNFSGLSYVSLYDHKDKYFLPMYDDLVSKIFISNYCHWRTTPSTCGSYITTRKILNEDFNDHTGVTVPVGDHHKWLFLTETKNRFIITPIPGLSTHCMEELMSPNIDWKEINK